MDIELFPDENLVDYNSGVFKRSYTLEGCKYYYIVAPELYSESGDLESTGAMHVLMSHPGGTSFFKLVLQEDRWVPEDKQIVLDEIFLEMIGNAIDSHNA